MADVTQLLSQLLYSRLPQVGGSGGSASGALTVNTTSTATIANTTETDLWSYTMPANTLSADGRTVRVTAWGTTGATANTKTVLGYVGGTAIIGTGAQAVNAGSWKISMLVQRTAASAQTADSESRIGVNTSNNATIKADTRALAIDTTAAIIIKVTGTNGTAAANDIVFLGAIVEILN